MIVDPSAPRYRPGDEVVTNFCVFLRKFLKGTVRCADEYEVVVFCEDGRLRAYGVSAVHATRTE